MPESASAEAAAAPTALLALAQDFSPRFEALTPEIVLVDVSGLDRLIGNADAVGSAICRLARTRRLPAIVTIAPTRTAAIILALAGRVSGAATAGRKPYRLVRPGDTAAALAPLPLTMLAALQEVETAEKGSGRRKSTATRTKGRGRGSGRHYRLAPSPGASPSIDRHATLGDLLQTLHRWGLETFADFTALPASDLFERLGSAGVAWQAVARGEDTRPLVRTVPEDPFEATMTLDWPVETLEPLSFVLGRLLDPLCLRLERAERGAAALQTTLQLVTRAAHVRVLELPAPMRDAKVLRTLILLDLESHPPDAGIDRVTLTIEPTPGRVVQHSLLTRARPSSERMATLTARLTAVLGDGRVGSPALVDSYEPGAFALCSFDGDANLLTPAPPCPAQPPLVEEVAQTRAGGEHAPHAGFVLRRLREPIAVRVEHSRGRPVRITARSIGPSGGRIVQAAGPWRTSGAWWTMGRREGRSQRSEVRGQKSTTTGEPGARSPEPGACPWDRDEWDVVVSDGTALRLSQDRATKTWVVEGVLD